MIYLATAALVVIAGVAVFIGIRFSRMARLLGVLASIDRVVHLSDVDRDLLANYRRYKPRVGREVKMNTHSAQSPLGRTESL